MKLAAQDFEDLRLGREQLGEETGLTESIEGCKPDFGWYSVAPQEARSDLLYEVIA